MGGQTQLLAKPLVVVPRGKDGVDQADNIISQTGLPVYSTEMDIGVADDTQQATIMKDIVTPLWTNENVKGVT
jgi:hypothetical protein